MFGFIRRLSMAVAESAVATKAEVNYRAKGSLRFGKYSRTTVMPRWWVEQSGHSAEKLVRNGTLEETLDPVVEDFRAPESRGELDAGPAMAEEMNALRKENSRVRSENKGLAANNESLRAKEATLTASLGEQTAAIAHWRQQAEARRAEVIEAEKVIATLKDELQSLKAELELERATTPVAGKPTKK